MTPTAPVTPQFVVDTHRNGTTEVVIVRGEVDIATAPLLRAVLETVVGRRPARVEVDLSGATFLDAHALTELAGARRRLAARRVVLVLRDPSPIALRLLELTGTGRLFEIATSVPTGIPAGAAEVRRAG